MEKLFSSWQPPPNNSYRKLIIPVIQNGAGTTYSYNLSGGGACLQDGVYHLNAAASAVTAGGTPMASAYASPLFHRLFGDTDGNKTINALDFARFKQTFGSSSGSAAYNGDLDSDNNGTVNALDYAQFKKRFGLSFNYV